jgi:F-type H+-transporting ATPase subunit epsilon
MADSIHLEIITSIEPPIKASIKQVYIPAHLGKAGVLEDHKPYISLLKPGEVFYTDIMNKNFYLYIREGFMEVIDNKIIIITDALEKGESLDKEELEQKLAEIRNRIQSLTKKEMADDELKKAPEELAKALETQKELKTKQEIVQKIEKEK